MPPDPLEGDWPKASPEHPHLKTSSYATACVHKKRQLELNDQFIDPTPDGTIGIYQSLHSRLYAQIRVLKHAKLSQQQELNNQCHVRVKLMQCRWNKDWKKATCNKYHIYGVPFATTSI